MTPNLSAHGDDSYRVTHYDIALDYRPLTARLSGRATVSAVAERALTEVRLDFGQLRVQRVQVDGARPATSTATANCGCARPGRWPLEPLSS